MAGETEKCKKDANKTELHVSPSCSSFEVLDPHDPVISRLATQLFKKTDEYIQGEVAAVQDYYMLLENMNCLSITKYADMHQVSINLARSFKGCNEKYVMEIQPLLQKIDAVDAEVSEMEKNVYKLDAYIKRLKARCKAVF